MVGCSNSVSILMRGNKNLQVMQVLLKGATGALAITKKTASLRSLSARTSRVLSRITAPASHIHQ